jgi:microcystin degradation protein MlrC
VIVISQHVEPHDLAAFEAVGVAPERLDVLMLKAQCRFVWNATVSSDGADGG